MTNIEVHDAGDLRKYRTEIPNLIFEMGLSPYALTLYIHLKRTAGQNGKCWKSVRTLASETGVSKSEIARTRKELEERELITVEQPKDPRKPSVVSIVDIWEMNFDHFIAKRARVPHRDATCPTDGHEERTLEEGVEANASSGKGSAKPQSVSLEKYIVDQIYDAMKDAGLRLANEQFTFHLGRAKDVLAKDEPTEDEIERLPESFVELSIIKGQADAQSALVYQRQQKKRAALLLSRKEDSTNGAKSDGRPPWEPIHPQSEEADKARNKPRRAEWYVTFFPSLTWEAIDEWIAEGASHSEILERLGADV